MDKTLLFGNGINQLTANSVSWKALLEQIKKNDKFADMDLPNTMIYERILMGRLKSKKDLAIVESSLKLEIANIMGDFKTNDFYEIIKELGFKNYLTTNYDYAFKNKFHNLGFRSQNNSTESIYSLRRNTSILDADDNEVCRIWNIHGEIDNPKSIMLGLDHYCGSIGKLDAYVKGTYDYTDNGKTVKVDSIVSKMNNNAYDNSSWVELLFNTNVHILGLSLDYSEIDLWWILNRRARIMNDEKTSVDLKNNIYYYSVVDTGKEEDKEKEKERIETLESFNVEVIKVEADFKTLDWGKYYKDVLTQIKNK